MYFYPVISLGNFCSSYIATVNWLKKVVTFLNTIYMFSFLIYILTWNKQIYRNEVIYYTLFSCLSYVSDVIVIISSEYLISLHLIYIISTVFFNLAKRKSF